MLPRRRWAEMRAPDFLGDTSDWVAVLPVAAIEQHGPHLPVSTDTTIAEGQVERVIELMPKGLPATFLPVQAVAKSNEHIASPGTLTLDWETVTKVWLDIGDSVARAGVKKLVIVTSHGGNVPIMDIVARELRIRHGMLAVATSWLRFGQPEGLYPDAERTYGIHGGDIETSIMLHLAPDLVDMTAAEDFCTLQLDLIATKKHLRGHGPAQFGWTMQDLNAKGAAGNAAAATAEKGRRSLDHAARGFIELLDDIHSFSPSSLWGS
ncbi:creatininase family protein [Hartmannibacter diazotrophicus]|nr:creatininase family protein [Hartmannibacter diazotrophicus]